MSARWHSREALAHQVIALATQGVAQRAIARSLGVSRNTVQTLLIGHRVQRESVHDALPARPARVQRAQKLDASKPRVGELLKRFTDITAQRVFETLCAEALLRKLHRRQTLSARAAPVAQAYAQPDHARLRAR